MENSKKVSELGLKPRLLLEKAEKQYSQRIIRHIYVRPSLDDAIIPYFK